LDVAVVVDGPYREEMSEELGRMVRVFTPRGDQDLQGLENLVRRAMGFNQERGDELTLVNVPFAASLEADVPQPPSVKDYVFDYGRPAIIGAVILLALLLLLRPLLKFLNSRQAQAPGRSAGVLRQVGPGDALPPGRGAGADGFLESELLEDDEPPQRLSLREQILLLVQQNPERAVAILKAWAREGRVEKPMPQGEGG
jgi:flagellar M-ring protein FliF